MAANMQHMMMPPGQQGQQPQHPQQQMRGANHPNVREHIFQSIIGQPVASNGWQSSYPAQERYNKASNLYARTLPRRPTHVSTTRLNAN